MHRILQSDCTSCYRRKPRATIWMWHRTGFWTYEEYTQSNWEFWRGDCYFFSIQPLSVMMSRKQCMPTLLALVLLRAWRREQCLWFPQLESRVGGKRRELTETLLLVWRTFFFWRIHFFCCLQSSLPTIDWLLLRHSSKKRTTWIILVLAVACGSLFQALLSLL